MLVYPSHVTSFLFLFSEYQSRYALQCEKRLLVKWEDQGENLTDGLFSTLLSLVQYYEQDFLSLVMFHLASKDICVQVVWCLELISTGEESDQQGWRACDIFNQNQNAEVSNLITFSLLFLFSSKLSHCLTVCFTQRQHRWCTCKATGKLSNWMSQSLILYDAEMFWFKLQQAIIDAASYVPPPPSEEQKKKIVKM